MADTSTYREAVIEAKKLREVAEANARNTLIEAVTPKVREFIERHLMGESVGEGDLISEVASEMLGDDEDEKDTKVESTPAAPVQESDKKDIDDDDNLILSKQAVEALVRMIKGQPDVQSISERLNKLKNSIKLVNEISSGSSKATAAQREKIVVKLISKMMRESVTLRDESIRIAGNDASKAVTHDIGSVIKEIAQMAVKRQMIKESDMFEVDLKALKESSKKKTIREADGDELPMDLNLDAPAGAEGDMPMGDEPVEGEEVEGSVEIPADLAAELMAALEGEIGGEEEGEEPAEEVVEGMTDETVVEIDEAMLRKEITRMREAAGKRSGATDPAVMSDFGGGSATKEVFVDGSDKDLNVHAEVKRLAAELKNESRKNRALGTQLKEFEQVTAKLREQLEQVNLFNAKLLYVNKLMTNENVTPSLRKKIVTVLDKASSLKEVRLLYKGLSESLSGARRETVNESAARRTSSASKPSSSGSAVKSQDPQVERWATLAGIRNNTK